MFRQIFCKNLAPKLNSDFSLNRLLCSAMILTCSIIITAIAAKTYGVKGKTKSSFNVLKFIYIFGTVLLVVLMFGLGVFYLRMLKNCVFERKSKSITTDLDLIQPYKLHPDEKFISEHCDNFLNVSTETQTATARVCLSDSDYSENYKLFDSRTSLQNVFKSYTKAAFVDVGAKVGMLTLTGAIWSKKVFAFEINTNLVEKLAHSIFLNKIENQVKLYCYALTDEHCLNLASKKFTASTTATESFRKKSYCAKHAKSSRFATLDNLIPTFERLQITEAVLHIGTEGSELEVLNGAWKFLAKINVPYIYITWRSVVNCSSFKKMKSCDKRFISLVIEKLNEKYSPTSLLKSDLLDVKTLQVWPPLVVWRKKNSTSK